MEFNQAHFNKLSNVFTTDEPCVSIFIPTYKTGHAQEDKIRFKNALSEAVTKLSDDKLISGRLSPQQIDDMLQPARALLDDNSFWMHLSEGLAAFISPGYFQHFVVPIDLNQLVYVSNHFYLRQLVPLLMKIDRFFILALSRDEVRLFEARQHSITPIKIKGHVPDGMEDVLSVEIRERSLQWHPETAKGPRRKADTAYHGHGLDKDRHDEDLEIYLRAVDDGLMEILCDEETPMILAATEEIPPMYGKISNYPNIVDFHVGGNPELDDPALLHEKAWSLMKDYFKINDERTREVFGTYLVRGMASSSLQEIVPAAINGRVDTLFVEKNAGVVWGYYKEADNSVEVHEEQKPYSMCLINKAVVETYRNSGAVYSLDREDMPETNAEMNAFLRY